MQQVLCRALVGRDRERATIEAVLDAAAAGSGRVLAVTGAQGLGKSRLLREAGQLARARRMSVLSGRAVEGGSVVSLRPLTEALLAHFRHSRLPEIEPLHPFRAALGLLVPSWRGSDAPVDASPVVVGEALLRLLSLVGGDRGCLLVVDDAQWADPETLAVVEYLADQTAASNVVCAVALRPGEGEGADRLLETLEARRTVERIELRRLTDDEVREMTRSCFEGTDLSPAVEELVAQRSDGVPFLVEELLAAVEGGALASAVPSTVGALVTRRIAGLGPAAPRLFAAAAVIGGRFDLLIAAAAAEVDVDDAVVIARAAVRQHLLVGESPGEPLLRFRHTLTREAVLDGLLAAERRALAARALAALEEREPLLPGSQAELAADLAEAAGDDERASHLLRSVADTAVADGSLATARAALARARNLVPAHATDLLVDVESELVHVLALAGAAEECLTIGAALLGSSALSPDQRIAVHLELAGAAVAADRWTEADQHVRRSQELLRRAADPLLVARVDVLAAHVARESGRAEECEQRARRALAASSDRAPDVACEALHVIGRQARTRDLGEARSAFAEAARIAEGAGSTVGRIRSLFELGTLDLLDLGPVDRLAEALTLAERAGALATVVAARVQIAWWWEDRGGADEMLEAARPARHLASLLGMRLPAAMAATAEAAALAQQGDRRGLDDALEMAFALGGDDPDVVAAARGHARSMLALVDDDRAAAITELDASAAALQAAGRTTPMPMWGLRALLRAVDGVDAEQAIAEGSVGDVHALVRGYLDLAGAVVAGRNGDGETADQLAAAAAARIGHLGWLSAIAFRHAAEAAVRDGWGQPRAWLLDALPALDRPGGERITDATRALLRATGSRGPRRKPLEQPLPEPLASMGVTRREAEVLALLATGSSTREIADALYVSPKTVERHVENLVRKTGTGSRRRLTVFAAAHAGFAAAAQNGDSPDVRGPLRE